jgi:hypothetical protein
MVTKNIPKTETFTLTITRLYDDTIVVTIMRQDGQTKSYQFPENKVRLFAAVDRPLKDAVDFLLGRERT